MNGHPVAWESARNQASGETELSRAPCELALDEAMDLLSLTRADLNRLENDLGVPSRIADRITADVASGNGPCC